MPSGKSIQIPAPCHVPQTELQPVPGGFYCDACRKTVVDFTLMSDQELFNFFKKAAGKDICGLFYEDQLNRELEIPRKRWLPAILIRKIAAGLLVFQSFTESASAQARKKVPETFQATSHPQPIAARQIQGSVSDYISGAGLEGVAIVITVNCLRIETISGKKGHFSFDLPENLPVDSVLTISGTEKNKPGNKEATTIHTEAIPLSALPAKGISLFRYPLDTLAMQEITTTCYNVPPLMGNVKLAGTSIHTEVLIKRPNLWQRIKHWFHPERSSR